MRTNAMGSWMSLIFATALCWSSAAEGGELHSEREPHPGIRILEGRAANSNYYAALIDLCADGVRVDARSPQATRISAPAWGQAMGMQLAVNGDFYRTDRSTPTVYGDAVGVGIRWPENQTGRSSAFSDEWYYQRYGWIGFGPGLAEFSHTKWVKDRAEDFELSEGFSPRQVTMDIPDGTTALVSGFSQLVVEGQVLSQFPDRGDLADHHPRTAMGLTEDRETFILAVVDGRSQTSAGMRGADLAELMADLGAYVAFNLDGGGSSQMWLAGEGVLNQPADGSPRPVANHWGVFASGEGEPVACVRGGDDGAETPDAGVGDAADAGVGELPDAGPGAGFSDAGVGDAPADGAGGCQAGPTTSGGPVASALLFLVLVRRWRRRGELRAV
jgi:uncharacterized protein (TIGR03382 family)